MLKKQNSVILRLIAAILLCALVLTGCMDSETVFHEQTTSGDLIQDPPQNVLPESSPTESTTTVHIHTFTDATCTLAKTCSVCSLTDGEPLGHNWTPATCTSPMTCETCGQTEGSPMEHLWKNATCTTPSTCKYCGQTTGTTIDHNWKDATCTTAATCIACGKTKGSAALHRYSHGTCTKCGKKDPSYDENNSSMVWIPTNGGKKYHTRSSCSNMKNPKKVTLSKAKQLGFTACKKCYR